MERLILSLTLLALAFSVNGDALLIIALASLWLALDTGCKLKYEGAP